MLSLIILRGLPGAGKTTLAKLLSEGVKWPVFSIDSYFTDPLTNEYNFQFDKNHLAYKNCEDQTRTAMENKTEKIFIDNVFSLDWEIEPYFKPLKIIIAIKIVMAFQTKSSKKWPLSTR
jgi:broad-specificity NMP kinase